MTHADTRIRPGSAKAGLAPAYRQRQAPVISLAPAPAVVRPEILFITSYPPRECGIATYTQDLLRSISQKFDCSFSLNVCALEVTGRANTRYPREVGYVLGADDLNAYEGLAHQLNRDENLSLIFLQHEFGLFGGEYGQNVLALLCALTKPVITTFHTVLPAPNSTLKKVVQAIAANSASLVVMTQNSARILQRDYAIAVEKIVVIPHGTHLVSSFDHTEKAARNHLGNRLVLTTFGLLSSGKSIETALDALPAIVDKFPNVLYLIIGKTHPAVFAREGEQYRSRLEQKVLDLNLQGHVHFVNRYLPLSELLGYLQRTDIYLFTSKDPNQAVSGTFAYAMGCGCPVISTPIPHAQEMLAGAGIIIDFQQPDQLAKAAVKLLSDAHLMREMKLNALHKIRPTAWPNAALAHVSLALKHMKTRAPATFTLQYNVPALSLDHIRKLTTDRGIIQFGRLSAPDNDSGYTLDDNARALVALCRYYQLTADETSLPLIGTYLNFVIRSQGADGAFRNYFNFDGSAHARNAGENLEDANGRAVWALAEFVSNGKAFKKRWTDRAESAFLLALPAALKMRSPRALSFVLKGLCYYNQVRTNITVKQHIVSLADDLVSKYRGVSNKKWKWFEDYLTYANAVMPEALLCAYVATQNQTFKVVAKSCFDFLLKIIFRHDQIKVVSNRGWLRKGNVSNAFGEQPIDVAYTIMALDRFDDVFPLDGYRDKLTRAFNWFLGKNHLKQIVYNPATGGCYDGLEEHHVNLNQGAESTISYLLSRLAMETGRHQAHQTVRNLVPERL
ncbi:MAG: glycosyltransferase [Cyclobacteriaceae bacterium]